MTGSVKNVRSMFYKRMEFVQELSPIATPIKEVLESQVLGGHHIKGKGWKIYKDRVATAAI
jgi:hypothetical protein